MPRVRADVSHFRPFLDIIRSMRQADAALGDWAEISAFRCHFGMLFGHEEVENFAISRIFLSYFTAYHSRLRRYGAFGLTFRHGVGAHALPCLATHTSRYARYDII